MIIETLHLVLSLSSIAISSLLVFKIKHLAQVFTANENLENIVITKATEVISSVYKENKKLRAEIKALHCTIKELDVEKALLNEKLVKITKQIDSFNKVFK